MVFFPAFFQAVNLLPEADHTNELVTITVGVHTFIFIGTQNEDFCFQGEIKVTHNGATIFEGTVAETEESVGLNGTFFHKMIKSGLFGAKEVKTQFRGEYLSTEKRFTGAAYCHFRSGGKMKISDRDVPIFDGSFTVDEDAEVEATGTTMVDFKQTDALVYTGPFILNLNSLTTHPEGEGVITQYGVPMYQGVFEKGTLVNGRYFAVVPSTTEVGVHVAQKVIEGRFEVREGEFIGYPVQATRYSDGSTITMVWEEDDGKLKVTDFETHTTTWYPDATRSSRNQWFVRRVESTPEGEEKVVMTTETDGTEVHYRKVEYDNVDGVHREVFQKNGVYSVNDRNLEYPLEVELFKFHDGTLKPTERRIDRPDHFLVELYQEGKLTTRRENTGTEKHLTGDFLASGMGKKYTIRGKFADGYVQEFTVTEKLEGTDDTKTEEEESSATERVICRFQEGEYTVRNEAGEMVNAPFSNTLVKGVPEMTFFFPPTHPLALEHKAAKRRHEEVQRIEQLMTLQLARSLIGGGRGPTFPMGLMSSLVSEMESAREAGDDSSDDDLPNLEGNEEDGAGGSTADPDFVPSSQDTDA